MIKVDTLFLLLVAHFIGDFVLQSDWMAQNKAKSFKAMFVHILAYSLPFYILFGFRFMLANSVAHLMVDTVTSRCTAYLYSRGHRHWFFVVIGLDQMLHYAAMFLFAGRFSL